MKAKELVELVAAETKLPSPTVKRVIKALTANVQTQLASGETVVVPGLGKFKPKDLPARTRQSKSGETKELPAGRVIKFKSKPREGKKKRARAAAAAAS